jgi:hypothetical protein
MLSQSWIVAPVVASSFVYAGWSLAPSSWRRWVARQLQRLWLPAPLHRWAQTKAAVASGCGCDGCDQKPASRAATNVARGKEQVLVFRPSQGLKRKKI